MNEVHRAAKTYVDEWGCSVIPLEAKAKRPPEGFSVMPYKSRRPDSAELHDWYADHADRGVAILCGGVSGGLLALDVDHPEHFTPWEEAHPELARTRRQKTRRGYHLLFYLRNRGTAPNDTTFYLDGQPIGDVKWKGYVIAEPTIHEETGRREHRWVKPEAPIMEVPSWDVLGLELKKRNSPPDVGKLTASGHGHSAYARAALKRQIGRLAMAREGERNVQLNASAFSLGQLIGAGLLDRREAEQTLAATALNIGLDPNEIPPTIRSGMEAGMGGPRGPLKNWERRKPRRLGKGLARETAENIERVPLPCPAPEIRGEITGMLRWRDRAEAKPLKDERREMAASLLRAWLCDNGGFIRSRTDGRLCYFYCPERRLFNLETDLWHAWLYALTGANPAGTDFAYLSTDCMAAAQLGEERDVVKVASWDRETETLRVSRFDGTVYVLDGENIIEEDNGKHVLFDDLSQWTPYNPTLDWTTGMALRWSTQDVTRFDGNAEMQALGYRAWILATFFTELCPTRPLLVLVGEKGSGKTMSLRVFLQLLFGPDAEVTGLPDKPDGFTAAASANPVLVLDNLDEFTPWLRDKVARLSTGAVDQYRRLYTSNEVGTAKYRTWLAFTARTPDTLKRDDLADRLLLLPTCFIPDDQRQPERHFLELLRVARDDWWADVLHALNGIVARIRGGEMANTSELRMADWESLGRLVARDEGKEDLWDEFVVNLKRQQSGFLLSDDLIVEALDEWLKVPTNHRRSMKSRELCEELATLLFRGRRPSRDWPKSVKAFGRKLASLRRDLRAVYQVEWWKDRKGFWNYKFAPLEE